MDTQTATASYVLAHHKLPSGIAFLLLPLPTNVCRLIRRVHTESRAAKRGERLYKGPVAYNRDYVGANMLGWNG